MKINDLLPVLESPQALVTNTFPGKPILKLPCWNDKKYLNIGAEKGVSAQTVVVKSTGTGQVYGLRTIIQKNS